MTPFTYCITHLKTGKRYYGSRYAKGCEPSQLGKTYFSSSSLIKKMIESEGISAFSFSVRRIFSNIEKCRAWEAKLLKRINASKSEMWLNRHNGGQTFYNIENSAAHRKAISDGHKRNGKLKGVPKSEKAKAAMRSAAKQRLAVSQATRNKISKRVTGSGNPMYGAQRDNSAFLPKMQAAAKEANKCPVICEGKIFSSVGDAQLAYPGCNICKRLNSDSWPEFYRLRPRTRRK